MTGVPDELRGEVIDAFVALKAGHEPSDELHRELLEDGSIPSASRKTPSSFFGAITAGAWTITICSANTWCSNAVCRRIAKPSRRFESPAAMLWQLVRFRPAKPFCSRKRRKRAKAKVASARV